jgi:glycosyltransferase involved in cell wall biosynthesis
VRILLLTQWFPPEPQKLLLELATTLRDQGHEVTVLTGLPNYPTGVIYPGYRLRLYQEEPIEGIRVIRVPLFADHSRNPMRRAANFLSFAVAAAALGPILAPKIDVIHVIHPPLTIGLAAWTISQFQRVPFTYEIQDLWPETLAATGMVQHRTLLRLVGWFALWVYGQAACLRVISPGFRLNLIAKGVPRDKIRFISNWVDTDFYRPVPASGELRRQLGFEQRFVVVYAGTVGPAQGLGCIVEAAALIRNQPDVLFAVFGEGIDRAHLAAQVAERGLNNVRFYGFHQPEKMPEIYALADVLLIHLNEDPLFAITIPHKTFVYLASAKPILAAVRGDVADVVSRARAGISCPPANPRALADCVLRLRSLSR